MNKILPLLEGTSNWRRQSLYSQIVQRLVLVSDGQEWESVVDAASGLSDPAIEGGAVRQSDGYFSDGTASFWSDESGDEIVDRTFLSLLVHYYNTNGSSGLWIKKAGPSLWYADQYALGTPFTLGQFRRNETFYGKGGGAERSDGEVVVDESGHVVFVAYMDSLGMDTIPPLEVVVDPEVLAE